MLPKNGINIKVSINDSKMADKESDTCFFLALFLAITFVDEPSIDVILMTLMFSFALIYCSYKILQLTFYGIKYFSLFKKTKSEDEVIGAIITLDFLASVGVTAIVFASMVFLDNAVDENKELLANGIQACAHKEKCRFIISRLKVEEDERRALSTANSSVKYFSVTHGILAMLVIAKMESNGCSRIYSYYSYYSIDVIKC